MVACRVEERLLCSSVKIGVACSNTKTVLKQQRVVDTTKFGLLGLQEGAPAEEDLKNWGQHSGSATVPDKILQQVGEELPGTISFVFTCKVKLQNAFHLGGIPQS